MWNKTIGDHLAYPMPWGIQKYRRFVIAAETPTMWVGQCGVKVRKQDGRIIGGDHRRVQNMTPELESLIVAYETSTELQRLMRLVDAADTAMKQRVVELLGPLFPKEGE